MDHTRHSEIYNLSHMGVTLIGAGGIGAAAGVTIAKMGISWIAIYDNDQVDEVNIPTQFHKYSDIGMDKAEALMHTICEFTDMSYEMVNPFVQTVDANTTLSGAVIISAVDSIKARQGIWQAVRNSMAKYYLDARMSAQEFHLYTVDMKNELMVRDYDFLINSESDKDIPDAPCTAKATIFCAMTSAGHISNALKRISNKEHQPFHLIHLIHSNEIFVHKWK